MSAQTPANPADNSQEIPTVIKINPFILADDQPGIHNRWHPEIPAVATVKPGQVFKVQCIDATGGQVGNNDSSDDINNSDLTKIHNLSGPVAVEGAEPGDCLVVDILDVTPFPDMPWGYTGFFDDGGLLSHKDEFRGKASKAIWDLDGAFATSRHIPGVRFAGIPHPGVIGTAPSHELLAEWNRREGAIAAAYPDNIPPAANPPLETGAHIGQDLPPDVMDRIKKQGARTIPGREHGGNIDIKNLSKGSRCYLPVYIPGGNVSTGDLHFSQGDGEIAWCGAIEISGIVTYRMDIIKGGVAKFALKQPIFLSSPIDPLYSRKLVFEGLSADINGDGKQHYMDATIAYRQAVMNIIAYLEKFGYTREQTYLLLSAAPIESRVAAVVDSPSACVTIGLPTAIFEANILPHEDGPVKRDYGQLPIMHRGNRSRYHPDRRWESGVFEEHHYHVGQRGDQGAHIGAHVGVQLGGQGTHAGGHIGLGGHLGGHIGQGGRR